MSDFPAGLGDITDVNANQLSGINMGSLGRFGYLFVNNTENSGSSGTLAPWAQPF